MTLSLFFGPCRLAIHSTNEGLLHKLGRDFLYFMSPRVEASDDLTITAKCQEPDWRVIRGCYLFGHFDGRVYGWGDRRWVRYAGSLVTYDAAANQGSVTSFDEELLHHYTYYLIIALVGKQLDVRGFHRFHALGVSVAGQAALFSMPISGGKTTLGLTLMENPAVSLYSEDTPLIDSRGVVHAFAPRLSLRDGHGAAIPERWIRIKNDPVFGKKTLVDLDYYGLHRVAAAPGRSPLVFWSVKSTQEQPSVRAVHPLRSLARLVYYIVIGKDCPQRAEVFLRFSPGGIRMMAALLFRRLVAAVQLWRNSRSYRFYMTPDVPANAAFIEDFIRKNSRSSGASG
jgi:hypothetical protein